MDSDCCNIVCPLIVKWLLRLPCPVLYMSYAGGDCKTLMFVQTSPSVADLGETICSLNFATRVRGVGTGPARKQADCTELFKYKQMVFCLNEFSNN